MGGSSTRNNQLTKVGDTAGNAYNQFTSGQTPFEKEFIPQSQDMWNTYKTAKDTNVADYGNIMKGYQDYNDSLKAGGPSKFGFQSVSAQRPKELNQAYGQLNSAGTGYQNFADTGGYSDTDVQELRARGMSPIRSAYNNTMMEMDRSRALGGEQGSPNYIAAASKAQRELPGQMSDAMTGVNATLANAIREGKLAGLSGLTNVGGTMGGLSGQESGRMLTADMANQNADLQSQQLAEQSLQNFRQSQLAGLSGQTGLYGTTPAMSSTFGNQALNAYGQRAGMEANRNQYSLGLLNAQTGAYGQQTTPTPWWQQVLGAAGSVLPYIPGLNKPKTTTPGPTGSPSPSGVNVNTPVTQGNWYNGAPQMGQVNSQNPMTSSNWYVSGQQPSSSGFGYNGANGDLWSGGGGGLTDWFGGGGGGNSNPWAGYNWGNEYQGYDDIWGQNAIPGGTYFNPNNPVGNGGL